MNNNNNNNNILTREKLLHLIYNRYFNEESTVVLDTFATNITVSFDMSTKICLAETTENKGQIVFGLSDCFRIPFFLVY